MTKLLTQFARLFILIVLGVSLSSPALAQQKKSLSDTDVLKWQYGEFRDIRSFGLINVWFEGEDAKKIGLSEEELTDYLKLRFKNNFANITYEDAIAAGIAAGEKVGDLFVNKAKGKKLGLLRCIVWVVGDDFPIAYHVKCKAGNFLDQDVWESANLGYGSKNNVPDSIKETLDSHVEELAILVFKVKALFPWVFWMHTSTDLKDIPKGWEPVGAWETKAECDEAIARRIERKKTNWRKLIEAGKKLGPDINPDDFKMTIKEGRASLVTPKTYLSFRLVCFPQTLDPRYEG